MWIYSTPHGCRSEFTVMVTGVCIIHAEGVCNVMLIVKLTKVHVRNGYMFRTESTHMIFLLVVCPLPAKAEM